MILLDCFPSLPGWGCQSREAGYDPVYGARPLLRVIQSKIEDELAEMVLNGTFKDGDTVNIGFEDEKITFNN